MNRNLGRNYFSILQIEKSGNEIFKKCCTVATLNNNENIIKIYLDKNCCFYIYSFSSFTEEKHMILIGELTNGNLHYFGLARFNSIQLEGVAGRAGKDSWKHRRIG